MHIAINTDEPISDVDRSILMALATGTGFSLDDADDAPAPVAPKPAAKKAPAKKAAAKPAPVEEAPEDEIDADALKEQALSIAGDLLAEGKTAKVKAALKEVGAGKVSDIAPEDFSQFIELLQAEDDDSVL